MSISVPPGTIVGLVGPNGAGKTTLFHVVSGLLRPQHGEVFLAGRRITNCHARKRARLGLARTFQQLELFMGLTVREHVVLGYRVRNERNRLWSDLFTAGALHRESREEKERVDYLVDLLGLTSVANTPAASLPLGTARRVEVARALATGPSVVLLDEPSSGLDAHETSQLGAALRRVVEEEKVSMLLVEHDVAMVLGLSSFVSVLDFGLCIARGHPRRDPRRSRGAGRVPRRRRSRGRDRGSDDERCRRGDRRRGQRDPAVSDSLLSVKGLNVRYASVQALFDVSLDVPEGSVVAVLGANGAGKSTLARTVSGLVPAFGGKVTFGGEDITKWDPHKIRREGLVHIPEGRGIFPGLSVQENLRMAVRRVGSTDDQRKAAMANAYEMFPVLADRRGQRAGTLSGGEQQMLALARALAVPPRLIIADEMSLGLAPLVVDFVFENIEQASKRGVTIVLIEQFIHRALALASECVILRQGSVAWAGPADNARQEVLDRYLGEAADAMN